MPDLVGQYLEAFENTNTLATLLVFPDKILVDCRITHHNDAHGVPLWNAYAGNGDEWHFRGSEVRAFNGTEVIFHGYDKLTPEQTRKIIRAMTMLTEISASLEGVGSLPLDTVEKEFQLGVEDIFHAWARLYRTLHYGGAAPTVYQWPIEGVIDTKDIPARMREMVPT